MGPDLVVLVGHPSADQEASRPSEVVVLQALLAGPQSAGEEVEEDHRQVSYDSSQAKDPSDDPALDQSP